MAANAGDWNSFWHIWWSSSATYSVVSPLAEIVLHLIDWLASEHGQRFPFRFEREWWPRETLRSLSAADIRVVSCMTAGDGRAVQTVLREAIAARGRERIVSSYHLDWSATAPEIDEAIAYLQDVANAIAAREGDRVLMILSPKK